MATRDGWLTHDRVVVLGLLVAFALNAATFAVGASDPVTGLLRYLRVIGTASMVTVAFLIAQDRLRRRW